VAFDGTRRPWVRTTAAYNALIVSDPFAPSVHTIETPTHGRYIVRPANGAPAGCLVGFHGYAQTAETFLADLESIPGAADWTLVAVQALHPFYTRSGQVVANWMTSLDRDLAIGDNLAYVGRVVRAIQERGTPGTEQGRPLVFLGFSQGAAMAFRAALQAGRGCDGVIALGGDIPPELRARATAPPPVLMGRGQDDEWYTSEKLGLDRQWLEAVGASARICEFDGGHFWTEVFRHEAGRFLAQLGGRASRASEIRL
jgi:predicted esterase